MNPLIIEYTDPATIVKEIKLIVEATISNETGIAHSNGFIIFFPFFAAS